MEVILSAAVFSVGAEALAFSENERGEAHALPLHGRTAPVFGITARKGPGNTNLTTTQILATTIRPGMVLLSFQFLPRFSNSSIE